MLPDGLTIGAVPAREDARDVLVSTRYRSVGELPKGARVATSSIRRKVQLLARRPDLQIVEIRGNVGTRLQKAADFDAIILAAAGLKRLGLKTEYHPLELDVMIPAVGQGAIACEVRADDFETQGLLAGINDTDTLACVEAERVFLQALGGGCQVPYAAHARVTGDELWLIGAVFEPVLRRTELRGSKSEPVRLGEQAANEVKG
jgi:hydroxymethylbilane synthase